MNPISKFTIALDVLEIMTEHVSLLSDVTDLSTLNRATAKAYYNYNKTTLLRLADVDKENSSNYHLVYTIKNNGKTVGTLFTARTKFYLTDKPLVKIRLDNHLLYSDEWASYLQSALADLNLGINNVTYLELALDANTRARELFYYYFDDDANYHFVGGKRLIDNISSFAKEYRNGEINKTIYIGKTNKKMSIYNKSLEIKEKSKKYYITDFHEKNGLDISQDIERIEIKLKNTALKRYETKYESQSNRDESISEYTYSKLTNKGKQNYKKVTIKTELPIYHIEDADDFLSTPTKQLVILDNLSNSDYLLSLFKENLLIDFREKTDSNINRCKPIIFIEFPNTLNIIKLSTMTLTPTKNDIKLKQLIKMSLKQFALTNINSLKESVLAVAKQYNLQDYFDKTLTESLPTKEATVSKETNDTFSFSL